MATDPPGDLVVTGRDIDDVGIVTDDAGVVHDTDTDDAGVVHDSEFVHHLDEPALGPVVVGEADIRRRIAELGDQITADYAGRAPLLICVLKGAFVFLADLARAIRLPLEVDFMAVSSYGASTKSSGVVRIVKDLDLDLAGRHVILVEDIVDSGLTLTYLRRNLAARQPASLEVCALFVRQGNQKTEEELRYVGFEIPPAFVLGYGLDVGERFRNLPYVCEFRSA